MDCPLQRRGRVLHACQMYYFFLHPLMYCRLLLVHGQHASRDGVHEHLDAQVNQEIDIRGQTNRDAIRAWPTLLFPTGKR